MSGSGGKGRGQAQYQGQAAGAVMGQKTSKQLTDL